MIPEDAALLARRASQRRRAPAARRAEPARAPRRAAAQGTPRQPHGHKQLSPGVRGHTAPRFKGCNNPRHDVGALGKALSTTHPSARVPLPRPQLRPAPDPAASAAFRTAPTSRPGRSRPSPHTGCAGGVSHLAVSARNSEEPRQQAARSGSIPVARSLGTRPPCRRTTALTEHNGRAGDPGPRRPRLTWGFVQLLQHGVNTVVEEELQHAGRPPQQGSDDAPQLLAHEAVRVVWSRHKAGRAR